MSWAQWPVTQAGLSLPRVINPAPTVLNPTGGPAPILSGAQYTPEQWAQMQQQNWQQWAQWQQQYQQWHQQYGAEYQKSLNAMNPTGNQPPLPIANTSMPPPLPNDSKPKPPLPPDEPPSSVAHALPNYQSYSTRARPDGNMENKETKDNSNKVPPAMGLVDNFERSVNQQDWQGQNKNWGNAPPSLMSLSVQKPSTFGNKRPYPQEVGDAKRGKFEQPSDRWQQEKPWDNRAQGQPPADTSVPPPNRDASEELSESEKKFIKQFAEWEAQFNKWKEQNVNHPDKEQYKEYEKKWEAWRTQLLERREQMRRKRLGLLGPAQNTTPAKTPLLPTPNVDVNKPPPSVNNEPLEFKPPELKGEGDSEVVCLDEDGGGFLKASTSDGIPGLDLVAEGDGDDADGRCENDDANPPDFEAISKGINSILGDEKLMSILSKVSQQQTATTNRATDSVSKMNRESDSRPFPSVSNDSFSGPTNDRSNFGFDDYYNQPNQLRNETFSNLDEQTRSSFGDGPNQYGKATFARGSEQPNYDSFKPPGAINVNRGGPFDRNPNDAYLRGGTSNYRVAPDGFRSGPIGFIRGGAPFGNNQGDPVSKGGADAFSKFGGGKFTREPEEFDEEDDLNNDPFEHENDEFELKTTGFNRGLDKFGRGPNDFSRGGDTFSRGPGNFGGGPDNFGRASENFNKSDAYGRGGPDAFRGTDGFKRAPDGFGRGPENFNDFSRGPNKFGRDDFGRGPGNVNRGPKGPDYDMAEQSAYTREGEYFNRRSDQFKKADSNYDNHKVQAPDEFADENIWKPASITDYDHKPLKKDDFEVSIEPHQTFDYRHKPANRVPLAERPLWLSSLLRNFREFEPVIGRSYDRYPAQDRYDTWRSTRDVYSSSRRYDEYKYAEEHRRRDDVGRGKEKFGDKKRWLEEDPEKGVERKFGDGNNRFDEGKKDPLKRDTDDMKVDDFIRHPVGGEKDKWCDNFERKEGVIGERRLGDVNNKKCEDMDKRGGEIDGKDVDRRSYDNERSYDHDRRRREGDDRWGERERWFNDDERRYATDKRFSDDRRFNDGDRRFSEGDRRFIDADRRFGEGDRKLGGGNDRRPGNSDRRMGEGDRRFGDVDRRYSRFDEKDAGRDRSFSEKDKGKKLDDDDGKGQFDHGKEGASNPPKQNVTLVDDLLLPPGRYTRPARIVIILRGPPGSGKTFLAKLIKDKEVEKGGSPPRILSLDDYFMVEQEKEILEDGKKVKIKDMVYEFEEGMEASYRASLFKSFKKTITDGYFPFIIVDNINDKVKYFGEMWSFAKQNGFQVYICQLELDVQTCTKRNIHGRTEAEIERCVRGWEPTPHHHPTLDCTSLIQAGSIPEVEMDEINSPPNADMEISSDEEQGMRSKWDSFDCSIQNLAKLDGTSKPLRPSKTMEDYLQLDDEWSPAAPTKPGQKRVRWADLEERKQQEKMRAIGFVVGQTDWDRMMDPTMGSGALTQTKYIERVRKY